jgi:hypothetical protein
VLDRVRLDAEELRFGGHFWLVRPSSRMLSEFLRYARRWGSLRYHQGFASGPGGDPVQDDPVSWNGREPLSLWRTWAQSAAVILDLARLGLSDSHRGLDGALARLPPDCPLLPPRHWDGVVNAARTVVGPGWLAAYLVNSWLRFAGGLTVEVDWPGGPDPEPRLHVSPIEVHLGTLGMQLALAMIGTRGVALCEGCARAFPVLRPTRAYDGRSLCPQCRDAARKRRSRSR